MKSGSFSQSAVALDGFYGRFITPNIEIGSDLLMIKVEGQAASGFIGPVLAIHAPPSNTSTTVPYIGAQIGSEFGSSKNAVCVGVFMGIKQFITKGGAITAQLDPGSSRKL